MFASLGLLPTLLAAASSAILLPRLGLSLLTALLLLIFLLATARLLLSLRLLLRRLLNVFAALLLLSFRLLLLHALPALALPTLARVTGIRRAISRAIARLLVAFILLSRPRRRLLRRQRSRGGIDLQHPPGRPHSVRGIRASVDGNSPVFKLASRVGADLFRHKLQQAIECPFPAAARQHPLRLRRCPRHTGLDTDTREPKIRIQRPHANSYRRTRRHPHRRFSRLLDRDLGSQIGHHLDAVLDLLELHLLSASQRHSPRLKEQPIRDMLRGSAVGIHLHHKRSARPRQIARPHLQFQIAAAVAIEIDPGRLKWLVTLSNEHDPRPFDRPQVALPGHFLVLPLHVGRKLIPHLADKQRWRIDHCHPYRLAPSITRGNAERNRLIESAGPVWKHGRIPRATLRFAANPRHLRPPGNSLRMSVALVKQRRHGDRRLLVAPKAADRGRHDQLAAADDRGRTVLDFDAAAVCGIAAGRCISAGGRDVSLFPRHPPAEPREFELDPCRRGNASPRGQQPSRGGEDAFGRRQRVDACQSHHQRQSIGEPHRQRAIDEGLRGHGGEPLRGPSLQRPHDRRRIALWMRLHEHRVDNVVVEFRMIPFDHSGRIDEIDAIPRQRQNPANRSGHERQQAEREPSPPRPMGQAAHHHPVLQQDAAGQPGKRSQTGPQQERRQGDPFQVGTGSGKPPGEIPLRLRVGLAVVDPTADDQRLGCWV